MHGWMCDVQCRSCGAMFQVHAEANAFSEHTQYCEICLTAKRYLESLNPPQPLAYHIFDTRLRRTLRLICQHPANTLYGAYVWFRYIRNKYGVEVAKNQIRLYRLDHIVLRDDEVIPW